jgi:hypothetical protein
MPIYMKISHMLTLGTHTLTYFNTTFQLGMHSYPDQHGTVPYYMV